MKNKINNITHHKQHAAISFFLLFILVFCIEAKASNVHLQASYRIYNCDRDLINQNNEILKISELDPPPYKLNINSSLFSGNTGGSVVAYADMSLGTMSGTVTNKSVSCDDHLNVPTVIYNSLLNDLLHFKKTSDNPSPDEPVKIPFHLVTDTSGTVLSGWRNLKFFSQGNIIFDYDVSYQNETIDNSPVNGELQFDGENATFEFSTAVAMRPLPSSSLTDTMKIVLDVPEGVTCTSGSGEFPGCHNEVNLSNVLITQAVNDEDGIVDLVLDRKTAIVVTIQSKFSFRVAKLRACVMNADGVCDENRILAYSDISLSLFSDSDTIDIVLYFTPSSDPTAEHFFNEGESKIIVEIDPDNLLSPENVDDKKNKQVVKFTKTNALKIPYIFLTPPICTATAPDFCSITAQDYDEHIEKSNIFMRDIFPLADDGLPEIKIPFDQIKHFGTTKTSDIFTGICTDLMAIEESLKPLGKRFVGLVPKEYIEYHGVNKTVTGITNTKITKGNKTAIVVIGNPFTTAHEIGHTFFGEKEGYRRDPNNPNIIIYDGDPITDGFQFSTKTLIKNYGIGVIDFMGREQAIRHFISPSHWQSLLNTFSTTLPDPELIVISSLIKKDGNFQLGTWSVFNGVPDFIDEGSYHILMKDENGNIISDIPFSLGFKFLLDEIGEFDSDVDYIAHAVPYPLATASISIIDPNGNVIVEVDATIKVLNDAINKVPDSCFINDPVQKRQNLINSVVKVDQLIKNYDKSGALFVIESEIVGAIDNDVLDECDQIIPTKTVKEQLTETIDSVLLHIEGRLAFADQDGDGILNDKDICPDSDLSNTVLIQNCNSEVINTLSDNGCSISDEIHSCEEKNINHGQFVNCISSVTNSLKRDNIITGSDKGSIQSCAAQANIQ